MALLLTRGSCGVVTYSNSGLTDDRFQNGHSSNVRNSQPFKVSQFIKFPSDNDISPVVGHPEFPSMSAIEVLIFLTGVLSGATDEFFTNWGYAMPCIADLSRILQIGFFIYLYLDEFLDSSDSQNIPYIALYTAYGSTAIMEQRCWIESSPNLRVTTNKRHFLNQYK